MVWACFETFTQVKVTSRCHQKGAGRKYVAVALYLRHHNLFSAIGGSVFFFNFAAKCKCVGLDAFFHLQVHFSVLCATCHQDDNDADRSTGREAPSRAQEHAQRSEKVAALAVVTHTHTHNCRTCCRCCYFEGALTTQSPRHGRRVRTQTHEHHKNTHSENACTAFAPAISLS